MVSRNPAYTGKYDIKTAVPCSTASLSARADKGPEGTTKNHIRHSLRAGHCTGQGSQTVFTPQPPKSLQCTFCHWQASGLDALLDHLARHAQRPGVQVESRHLFQSLHHGPVGVEQGL